MTGQQRENKTRKNIQRFCAIILARLIIANYGLMHHLIYAS